MPPNPEFFKQKMAWAIETGLGGETCTITIPTTISYDYDDGEVETGSTTTSFKCALLKTTKDDLVELPDGLRAKVKKKVFTVAPLVVVNAITSDFDGAEYKIIVPSAVSPFGNMAIGYITYLGKIETDEY